MDKKIGQTAGLIWDYLNKNGAQSLSALAKATVGDKNLFHWGIGWLAREGKLHISKEKGKYIIQLSD